MTLRGKALAPVPRCQSHWIGHNELYDPSDGQSVLKDGPVQFGAFNAGAVALSGGKILFCGGGDPFTGFETRCTLYDAGSDSWQPTGTMLAGRNSFSMTLLADGRVLVAGGNNGHAPDAEMYDPNLGTFTAAGNFLTQRSVFTASLLPDGQVLFAVTATSSGAPAGQTQITLVVD